MPRLLVYYHFFHPNDVVSARQFSDLAAEQGARGWEVIAVTSDRDWHDPSRVYPARERWQGVDVHRVHRPAWPQARAWARLGNSGYMLVAWAAHARRLPAVDAIVIGSDPAFAALLALPLSVQRPHTPILHWCFDLYPEAIEAEGTGGPVATLAPLASRLMGAAYRRCDVLVDIGSTMRRRLQRAVGAAARHETLTPWALVEPAAAAASAPEARAALFPAETKLALLYAGTMGRAHDFALILALARACRARSGRTISFSFACRGHRMDELRAALGPDDSNVSLAPFGSEAELPARLAAADLHVVSLRSEWEGIVVPSKFFASLAVGRPVLFAGPGDSEIARWIGELGVGLCLHGLDQVAALAERLHVLAADGEALRRWQGDVHARYGERFSKRVINDRWDELLRETVTRRR